MPSSACRPALVAVLAVFRRNEGVARVGLSLVLSFRNREVLVRLGCNWGGRCLAHEGVHSYNSRIVAYRNDFCLSCEAPRRAHQVRSFKAYRVFYIPVLPLGFWREWQCSEC